MLTNQDFERISNALQNAYDQLVKQNSTDDVLFNIKEAEQNLQSAMSVQPSVNSYK